MSSARLLVVRPARTAANGTSLLCRADVPLDRAGVAQARTIADRLSADRPDRIFCSPLQRARDTAAPLAAALGLGVEVHAELCEFDGGIWEGTPQDTAVQRIGTRDPQLPVPGGESLVQAWERLSRFRSSVRLDRLPGCSVVVGHLVVNRLLVAMLLGRHVTEALRVPLQPPAPGSVVELRRTGRSWRLQAVHRRILADAP